jgi:hypothetical protein
MRVRYDMPRISGIHSEPGHRKDIPSANSIQLFLGGALTAARSSWAH